MALLVKESYSISQKNVNVVSRNTARIKRDLDSQTSTPKRKHTKYKYWYLDANDTLSSEKKFGRFYYRLFFRWIIARAKLKIKRKWYVTAARIDRTYIDTFAEAKILAGDQHDPTPYLKHMCLYLPPIFGGQGFEITPEEASALIRKLHEAYEQRNELYDKKDYNINLMATAYQRPFNTYKMIKCYIVENNPNLSAIDNEYFKSMVRNVVAHLQPYVNIKLKVMGEVDSGYKVPDDTASVRHVRIAYDKCAGKNVPTEAPFHYTGPDDPKLKILVGTEINICMNQKYDSNDLSRNLYYLCITLQHQFLHILGLNHNPNKYSLMAYHLGKDDQDSVVIDPLGMNPCDYIGLEKIYGPPKTGKPSSVKRMNNEHTLEEVIAIFDNIQNIVRFKMQSLPPMAPITDVCSGKYMLYEYLEKWNNDEEPEATGAETDTGDTETDTDEPDEGDENPSTSTEAPPPTKSEEKPKSEVSDPSDGDESPDEIDENTSSAITTTSNATKEKAKINHPPTKKEKQKNDKQIHFSQSFGATGKLQLPTIPNRFEQFALGDSNTNSPADGPTPKPNEIGSRKNKKTIPIHMNRFYNHLTELFRTPPKTSNPDLKYFTLNSPIIFYIRNCDPKRIQEEIDVVYSLCPQNYRYCFIFTYCCDHSDIYDQLEMLGHSISERSKTILKYNLTRLPEYISFVVAPNEFTIKQQANDKQGTIYGSVANLVVSHLTTIGKPSLKLLKEDLDAGKNVIMPMVDPEKYLNNESMNTITGIMDLLKSVDLGISSILYSSNVLVRPYPFNSLNALSFIAPVDEKKS